MTDNKQNLEYEFLNSLNDEDLRNMIQKDISETMYSIKMCYNYEYHEFLKKHNIKEWKNITIFDDMSEEDFSNYIKDRLSIQTKEIRYLEFIV